MKHRLFLSIDLPPTHRSDVIRLQNQLESLKAPVSWIPPEKLHLTLNFIGGVEGELIPDILKKVNPICQRTSPFTIQPYFLETLYSRHEPSIVYLLPVSVPDILSDFQKQLSEALSDLELAQPRKFLPRFTIGKLQRTDPVATKRFLDTISEFEFTPLTPFPVEKITLYQSLVFGEGSQYQKLHDLSLG